MMCGGTSEEKDITDDVKKICEEIRVEAESKANEKFEIFVPLKYKSQVVAGTNYFIKIQVADGKYIHVRIYEPLPHTGESPQVHSLVKEKTADESIEYF